MGVNMQDSDALPASDADDVVEIIVCQGPPRCDGGNGEPCPYCHRIIDDGSVSEEIICDSMSRLQS